MLGRVRSYCPSSGCGVLTATDGRRLIFRLPPEERADGSGARPDPQGGDQVEYRVTGDGAVAVFGVQAHPAEAGGHNQGGSGTLEALRAVLSGARR